MSSGPNFFTDNKKQQQTLKSSGSFFTMQKQKRYRGYTILLEYNTLIPLEILKSNIAENLGISTDSFWEYILKHEEYIDGTASTHVYLKFKERLDAGKSKFQMEHFGEPLLKKIMTVTSEKELPLSFILKDSDEFATYLTNMCHLELALLTRVLKPKSLPTLSTKKPRQESPSAGLSNPLSKKLSISSDQHRQTTNDNKGKNKAKGDRLTDNQRIRIRKIMDELNGLCKTSPPDFPKIQRLKTRLHNWYYKLKFKSEPELLSEVDKAMTLAKARLTYGA